MGRIFPCSIGKGGISATKTEGDGATPVGQHKIVGALYRADRMRRPVPWAVPIRPGDLWSDDIHDDAYNSLVRAPYQASHEKLHRADPLYDLILLTDWNWPNAAAGRGSAIFIHRWRRAGYPTEGCVAFAPSDLLWIVKRLTLRSRLIVRGR